MKGTQSIILIPALVVLLMMPSLGWGQANGSITGEVVDQTSGDNLVGANVRLDGTNMGSATNIEGEFIIRRVPEDSYTLIATYLGYQQTEMEIEVAGGEALELQIEMARSGLEGDEITFSVQARGQTEAINRQLSRRTISNIVSSDRIREVPDANAAESIGRLPGISIQRSGGEASKVAIRGLSPNYNAITVEGVRLPATDQADRSVDLSMISPNMLDGIEVTKAIMPNQDADAIGGTVDMSLREAPEDFHTDFSIEGGYNGLQQTYDNYQVSGSVSNRFLNERFGAIVNFNLESRDRSTDTYNAGYDRTLEDVAEEIYTLRTQQLRLQENTQTRERYGGSLILDYQLPDGRIAFNSFYNNRVNNETIRTNFFDADGLSHEYEIGLNKNNLNITSNVLSIENDFDSFSISTSAAYSRSVNHSPDNLFMDFEEQGGIRSVDMDRQDPTTIPGAARLDVTNTNAYSIYKNTSETEEENYDVRADVNIPYRISSFINGSVDVGGKVSRSTRFNDEGSWGIGYLNYGGGSEHRRTLAHNLPNLCDRDDLRPEVQGFCDSKDEGTVSKLPISAVWEEDYERSNFLPGMEGDWPVGFTPETRRVEQIHGLLEDEYERDIASLFQNDYEGEENRWATYAMTEINFGNQITFIPGFRYENTHTEYSAYRTRETGVPARGEFTIAKPGDENYRPGGAGIQERNAERNNEFFLPMYHLQIKPTDWMDVRLARTNSISRPSYNEFSPRFYIHHPSSPRITAGNPDLEPSEALAHDISFAFYTNEIGLFTVSGFHKQIEKLIWWHSFPDRETEEGGRFVEYEYTEQETGGTPQIDTFLNNEYDAEYYGVEFDLQTNFWWLPSPFDGIVLSMNYSRITSETTYRGIDSYTRTHDEDGNPINPPFGEKVLTDTTRTGRMPDQPDDIANVQVGYDYGGFSARVSFLYQGSTLTSIGSNPEGDQFTDEYFRVDARVSQQLFTGLEVYANLNNINSRPDRNYQAVIGNFPTYNQNYGATFDLGVRYRY